MQRITVLNMAVVFQNINVNSYVKRFDSVYI